MNKVTVFTLLVAMCGTVIAEDGDGVLRSDLKSWNAGPGKAQGANTAKARVAYLENLMAAVKRARITPNVDEPKVGQINGRTAVVFPSSKSKSTAIDNLKEEIAAAKEAAKNPLPDYPIMYVTRLSVGMIGKLAFPQETDWRFSSPGDIRYSVVQIVDDSNMIVDLGGSKRRDKVTVWITMPTTGMVDDQDYKTGETIFEVVETKQYGTVSGGTKTLFRLVPRTAKELVLP